MDPRPFLRRELLGTVSHNSSLLSSDSSSVARISNSDVADAVVVVVVVVLVLVEVVVVDVVVIIIVVVVIDFSSGVLVTNEAVEVSIDEDTVL